MAATKSQKSSFSRISSHLNSSRTPELKCGPNGTIFVSSGIPDLDKILGYGFPLGSLVMVMEDAETPHHMLLLRHFMSQGLVHKQPLLYASPSRHPRGFLGTLPQISVSSKDDKYRDYDSEQEKGLRIAWQYKKYFGEHQQNFDSHSGLVYSLTMLCTNQAFYKFRGQRTTNVIENTTTNTEADSLATVLAGIGEGHCSKFTIDSKQEYCNKFNLQAPLERHYLSGQHIDCLSLEGCTNVTTLRARCATFLAQVPRNDGGISCGGRIAIQSFCAPQCEYSNKEWEMLSFIKSLKSMIRSSNAVAVVTFPPSLVSPSVSKRLQHMADTLLSIKAIPDGDIELAKLLTGYKDMVGLLNVHKVASFNTQVPVILEATTYSIKVPRRKHLVLECLNQAPIDGSSGSSYGTSGSKKASLDF